MSENLPTIKQDSPVSDWAPISINVLVQRVKLIQEAMSAVMKKDVHYGIIPGTPKPSLYKPGAEVLCMLWQLRPQFQEWTIDLPGGHREVKCLCSLYTSNGALMAQCFGSCSTLEKKYRWRDAQRKCPNCNAAAIIKGKKEYGGGWLCFAKKGGCGSKWADGAVEIEDQEVGTIENPDVADQFNTVLKMSQKRAYVGCTITATGCSDIFTHDVEDLPDLAAKEPAEEKSKAAPSRSAMSAQLETTTAIKNGTAYQYDTKRAGEQIAPDQKKIMLGRLEKQYGLVFKDGFGFTSKPIPEWSQYLMNDPSEPEAVVEQPKKASKDKRTLAAPPIEDDIPADWGKDDEDFEDVYLKPDRFEVAK